MNARLPSPVEAAVGLYRMLLVTLPPGFGGDLKREMTQVFAATCLRAHTARGIGGVLRICVRAVTDLSVRAPREWIDHLHKPRKAAERKLSMLETFAYDFRYAIPRPCRSASLR